MVSTAKHCCSRAVKSVPDKRPSLHPRATCCAPQPLPSTLAHLTTSAVSADLTWFQTAFGGRVTQLLLTQPARPPAPLAAGGVQQWRPARKGRAAATPHWSGGGSTMQRSADTFISRNEREFILKVSGVQARRLAMGCAQCRPAARLLPAMLALGARTSHRPPPVRSCTTTGAARRVPAGWQAPV